MIKLTFTGDVMCEGTRLNDYLKSDGSYDFNEVFSNLRQFFSKSDYVIANLETPLAGEELKYTYKNYSFNTPDAFAKALKNNKVDMVTTANNHVLDRGIEGLEKTISTLDQIGLAHTGSFARVEDNRPLIVNVADTKIAFLSYTYGTEACFNGFYLKKGEQLKVNLLRNQELTNPIRRYFFISPHFPAKVFRLIYRTISPKKAKIDVSQREEKNDSQLKHLLKDIKWCKEQADYTIMCLHCGGQFSRKPTEYTKQMVEFCLNAGVDAVVGNHEHIIHPMEMRNHHPIAFCLGNFTSDYGIRRNPMNQLAEYSALLNLYVDDCKCVKATFLLVKSVEVDGKIVTISAYDYWQESSDRKKLEIENDIKKCVFLIKGYLPEEFQIQEEYEI